MKEATTIIGQRSRIIRSTEFHHSYIHSHKKDRIYCHPSRQVIQISNHQTQQVFLQQKDNL